MKLLLLSAITAAVTIFSCSPNDSSKCKEPASSCNDCFRIYDHEDNFVYQGSFSGSSILWDGTDCNGNKVSCGTYSIYVSAYGQVQMFMNLVANENSVLKTGRSACDSLKNSCEGYYDEIMESTPFFEELNCICCK